MNVPNVEDVSHRQKEWFNVYLARLGILQALKIAKNAVKKFSKNKTSVRK